MGVYADINHELWKLAAAGGIEVVRTTCLAETTYREQYAGSGSGSMFWTLARDTLRKSQGVLPTKNGMDALYWCIQNHGFLPDLSASLLPPPNNDRVEGGNTIIADAPPDGFLNYWARYDYAGFLDLAVLPVDGVVPTLPAGMSAPVTVNYVVVLFEDGGDDKGVPYNLDGSAAFLPVAFS